MAKFNKVIVAGNLTRDPEQRTTGNQKFVSNFDIAINGNKDGEVCFIKVVAWEKLSELVQQYLVKGSAVLVEGSIIQENWEKDGVKKSVHKIVANNIQFLSEKHTTTPATPAANNDPDDEWNS